MRTFTKFVAVLALYHAFAISNAQTEELAKNQEPPKKPLVKILKESRSVIQKTSLGERKPNRHKGPESHEAIEAKIDRAAELEKSEKIEKAKVKSDTFLTEKPHGHPNFNPNIGDGSLQNLNFQNPSLIPKAP